ncbi:Ger(x)C family spore germination protein [Paenibacillus paridis]|uniref:Ger(x)C family spore germination protein n=1 Tax=Paenibacillus paridis TaxID=2583376 RepID=UPI00112324DF|nr:Ger(x)C family spore germination protein [Paenibacillus paridis]
MRKQVILLFTVIAMFGMTGCWSRVELNDVAIVTATALDLADRNKIQVSIQVLRINMNNASGGNATVLFSEEGESILDAYRIIQKKIPRHLNFAHNRVIIVGDKLARSGMSDVIEFFSRYRDARGNSYLLATKGKAADLLKIGPSFEKFTAEEIREEQKAKVIDNVSLREFAYRLLEGGIEPIASQIQSVPSSDKALTSSNNDKKKQNNEWSLALVGVGVFRKDHLIGWMNAEEAECLLWFRNKVKGSVITTMLTGDKRESGKLSVQIMKSKTTIKPKLQEEKVSFDVRVEMIGDLYENTTKLSTNSLKNLETIQLAVEAEIQSRIKSTVKKLQLKYKSDIVGFGRMLHREHKKEWNERFEKRWEQEFPHVKVNVTAHFKIIGTGRINDSLTWEERDFKK